jgi:predicted nucleotidyltransferase
MQPIITENREKIAELCRAHHVRRLSVFGSAVRDDFDPERSDVDFMVEFEPSEDHRDFEVQSLLKEKLTELFDRPVDLIRAGLIRNPYLLREILNDQVTLYAAAASRNFQVA